MLDFTDKLILRNVYKSRELHPLTSAPSWGRVTTFSENGFPVAVTEQFLVEVIHFLLLEKDRARVKNFTVMFMMLMNINHRSISPAAVALGRLSSAKGVRGDVGIIWFRRHRNKNQLSPLLVCWKAGASGLGQSGCVREECWRWQRCQTGNVSHGQLPKKCLTEPFINWRDRKSVV